LLLHSFLWIYIHSFKPSNSNSTIQTPFNAGPCFSFFTKMQLNKTFLAMFLALSLVSASPVGRLSFGKRQNAAENPVVITVTSASTSTVYNHHRVTKTVTVLASLVDPPQRAAPAPTAASVETPAADTPSASPTTASPTTPVVVAAVVATSPVGAAEPATTTAAAAAAVSPASSASGTAFSGDGTYYSAGYVSIHTFDTLLIPY
jgi:hypothetical protein